MSRFTEQLQALVHVCDSDERELIERMIHSSADYVRQVVIMESTRLNFAGRQSDDLRAKVSETDKVRTDRHNALIATVNIVNRICDAHHLPRIYCGSEKRREYGDFAIELTAEIFNDRV
ncbi:MAG: DUF3232 domain-containing protein [Oscillospiraceae bacterium]|nr:DUF3232 domain-containing protein [Oscillospiraceae bacterium]